MLRRTTNRLPRASWAEFTCGGVGAQKRSCMRLHGVVGLDEQVTLTVKTLSAILPLGCDRQEPKAEVGRVMDDLPRIVSETLRWIAPVVGLAVSILAMRRFRTRGTGLAVLGFGLALVEPSTRIIVRSLIYEPGEFTAQDIVVLSYVTGIAGLIGSVLVVLALRRLIHAAEGVELGHGGAE